jgi:hypothetical protein
VPASRESEIDQPIVREHISLGRELIYQRICFLFFLDRMRNMFVSVYLVTLFPRCHFPSDLPSALPVHCVRRHQSRPPLPCSTLVNAFSYLSFFFFHPVKCDPQPFLAYSPSFSHSRPTRNSMGNQRTTVTAILHTAPGQTFKCTSANSTTRDSRTTTSDCKYASFAPLNVLILFLSGACGQWNVPSDFVSVSLSS